MKEVRDLQSQEVNFDSGRVQIQRWAVLSPGEEVDDRPFPRDDIAERMAEFYHSEVTINGEDSGVKCLLPFTRYLHFTDALHDFSDAFVQNEPVETTTRSLIGWNEMRNLDALTVARYARLRQKLNPTHDEAQAHVIALAHDHDRGWDAELAPGFWSDSRTSMDSGDVRIEVRPEDSGAFRLLAEELVTCYGNVTVREVLHELGRGVDLPGTLPVFGRGEYQHSLGVGGTTYCEADGVFVYTRRARGVHVNMGPVYMSGGGVKWAIVLRMVKEGKGLFEALDLAMETEHRDEAGEGRFTFERTGMVRELARAGSPEFFYLQRFAGGVRDLLPIIAGNTHRESKEVDRIVYACTPEDVARMLRSEDGTRVIQRKGMIILYFALKRMGLW